MQNELEVEISTSFMDAMLDYFMLIVGNNLVRYCCVLFVSQIHFGKSCALWKEGGLCNLWQKMHEEQTPAGATCVADLTSPAYPL